MAGWTKWAACTALLLSGACGDDDRPAGVDAGGGVDSGPAVDSGGGGGEVPIPTITGQCSTTACAANTMGGIAFLTYIDEVCATALGSPGTPTQIAGRGSPFSCAGGTCTTTSDDAPGPWEDDGDVAITTMPAGSYGVVAWFDNNDNILMGGGPDAGDALCCIDATVDSATTSFDVGPTSCVDL